ncbi:MAG: hypothetical protein ACRDPG_04250, partial [Nocardioidaceae bacterium]
GPHDLNSPAGFAAGDPKGTTAKAGPETNLDPSGQTAPPDRLTGVSASPELADTRGQARPPTPA